MADLDFFGIAVRRRFCLMSEPRCQHNEPRRKKHMVRREAR
jgi:hypothetical protein